MWTYKTEKSNFVSLNDFNFAKLFTENFLKQIIIFSQNFFEAYKTDQQTNQQTNKNLSLR